MDIGKRQRFVLLARDLQAFEELIERDEFHFFTAALGVVRSLRSFTNPALAASKRNENITSGGDACIRAAGVHDHLHKMIDLCLARLLDRHGNGNTLSRKNARSFIFRMNAFQKILEHRSVRMDIGAEDLEIQGLTPYAVLLLITQKVDISRKTDLFHKVHGRARVLLTFMNIRRLFDRKFFAGAIKTNLSRPLENVGIQALTVRKAELERRQSVTLASLTEKAYVILNGMADNELILTLQKRADPSVKRRKSRRFPKFLFRISK